MSLFVAPRPVEQSVQPNGWVKTAAFHLQLAVPVFAGMAATAVQFEDLGVQQEQTVNTFQPHAPFDATAATAMTPNIFVAPLNTATVHVTKDVDAVLRSAHTASTRLVTLL